MDQTPTSYSNIPNEPATKSRSALLTVVGLIGFLVLVTGVNGTAYYFGTKTSSAKTPTALPLTQTQPMDSASAESKFTNSDIPLSFSYSSALGTPVLTKATDSTIGTTKEGEDWWQIQFDERNLVAGYVDIGGATPGFIPNSWGNTPPLWNTTPVIAGDEASARMALEKMGHTVISIKPSDPLVGFQAWSTTCKDETCFLFWHVIFPQTSKYASIQISSVIATFPKDDSIQATAENMINSIETEGDTNPIKAYVDRASGIANSFSLEAVPQESAIQTTGGPGETIPESMSPEIIAPETLPAELSAPQ